MDMPCRTAAVDASQSKAYGARLETTSKRMRRFLGLPPSRNAAGRSLPSDRHVQRVTVRLACEGPAHTSRRSPRVLGGFWIYSWYDAFSSIEVNEELPNKGVVDRSFITDEGGEHQRYLFQCQHDGCSRTPSFRADTIDGWLAEEYETGVYDKLVYRFV
jgi:hypothetical protein